MDFTLRTKHFGQVSLLAITLAVAGCGSTPKPTQSRLPVNQPVEKEKPDEYLTPQSLIALAKNAWEKNGDAQAKHSYLLDAALAFMGEKKFTKAQHLLNLLKSEPLSDAHRIQLNTILVQLYKDDDTADTDALLALLTELSTEQSLRQTQLQLRQTLYERKHAWMAAANALLASAPPSAKREAQIWQWINQASPSARQQVRHQYPALRPYVALFDIAQQHGLDNVAYRQAVAQFTQVYRGEAIATHLPENIKRAASLSGEKPRAIVALLPLSGKLAASGMAIKEGMLSSYFASSAERPASEEPVAFHFVDTVGKTPDELLEAIRGYRWVIGPLLKENVESLAGRVPPGTTMLALNRLDPALPSAGGDVAHQQDEQTIPASPIDPVSDTTKVSSFRAYFALAPEDEARQLANTIFARGFKTPVVVSAQNNINQRMRDAFTTQWQTLNAEAKRNTNAALTEVSFTDSTSLRKGITEALDVAQSHDRIRQIEYMVNEQLYNVPRNRRDVDAIIVFASPSQTELLNPMVEASLSPFNGKTVPVFATSRSIEYDDTKNQWRDLQNVHFLDMPWMMPEHKWKALQATASMLWPQRDTQMSRLFAFGADAYHLLPYVPVMSTLPQTSIDALTGRLQINSEGQVERLLPQAIIDNQRVRLVALPESKQETLASGE
ncbi:penicillin-binding protein activator [Aestuariibacter sp. A3R04]|uniref:penicillin-binding protein activator n=1 Tax=Aestuariibacter sp. A3R04 TaxID=2841571 RepID=UPI001C09FC68|nr:penicillin-binding protein activator [Aestuariibacter sp. A3R04]